MEALFLVSLESEVPGPTSENPSPNIVPSFRGSEIPGPTTGSTEPVLPNGQQRGPPIPRNPGVPRGWVAKFGTGKGLNLSVIERGYFCNKHLTVHRVVTFIGQLPENRVVKPTVLPTVGRRGLGGVLRNIRS